MGKRFRSLILAAVCVFLLFSSGCAAAGTQIAYTVYPVGYLIERLAGVTVTAESLQDDTVVQRASIRGDYQQVLAESAVFMHIGELEPYLTVYGNRIRTSGTQILDLSALNAVYEFRRYTEISGSDEIEYAESPYYEGELFENIDTNGYDLNLWLDPIAMLSMAKDIHAWLVSAYPENKALYDGNLDSLETDLINLDAQYQSFGTSVSKTGGAIRFVSMTASFGNWQKTYGFEVYPVVLSKYGVLPDEEQLAAIEDRIEQDDVRYIAYEPNMPDDMKQLYERIREDLDLEEIRLSNLCCLTDEEMEEGKDYLSIMYENLGTLQTMEPEPALAETAASADAENGRAG